MSALEIQERRPLIPGATETGLSLPDYLTEDQWRSIGEDLGRVQRASQWWIGDWINYAETKWGEKYDDAQKITGLSYDYLRHCASVSSHFQFGDRSPNLSWTHYYKAKALPDPEQWLARAEAEDWSVRDLLTHARGGIAEARLPFVITTERQRHLAEASKLRIEKAVGACNGMARGLDELKIDQAVAAATPGEISGWDAAIGDAIAALRKLRARLKEA